MRISKRNILTASEELESICLIYRILFIFYEGFFRQATAIIKVLRHVPDYCKIICYCCLMHVVHLILEA